MFELYRPGQSWLHRMRAGHKVLALALSGTGLFLLPSAWFMGPALALVLGIFQATGLGLGRAWAQIRPVLWILVLIFVVQIAMGQLATGVLVVSRFACLLLLAGLLTLTTRVSDMLDAIQAGLRLARPLGVNPVKAGLAISIALRFIPVLARITDEVREAQKTRGLERSLFAIAVPVITRMMKMSDDISDAIDARGFDPHGS